VTFGYEIAVLGQRVPPLTALVGLAAIVVGAGVVGKLPVHSRRTIPARWETGAMVLRPNLLTSLAGRLS
jgi:xanthosine utilization system XapX-like protein